MVDNNVSQGSSIKGAGGGGLAEALDPIIDAWPFFNPVSLAGSYGSNSFSETSSAEAAAKRSKVR